MRRGSIRQLILIAAVLLVSLSFWQLWFTGVVHAPKIFSDPEPAAQLPCRSLPGAHDTLVVLKTGATELQNKLPIHLETTTRCYPNFVVYSDYEEAYQGQFIIDTLESVSQNIRNEHPDFDLYRRLKQYGRSGLRDGAFSRGSLEIKMTGDPENPGWKLDKWKFLPMVNRTLSEFPNMKWYVFAEVDTYIVWTSLLQYLSTLDSTKPLYTGMYMSIAEDTFAYGGSGFVVSRSAMENVVAYYQLHQNELEAFVDFHWAGDCVLGKALFDAGVPLTNAWPIIQGDYPGWLTFDMAEGRSMTNAIGRLWCNPVATFHHVSPDAVRDMWDMEQKWIAEHRDSTDGYLLQKDVFDRYTMPQMANSPRMDWDNDCDQEGPEARSMEECKQACQSNSNCLQYSFEESSSKCRTRETPRLGFSKDGFRSGWLMDRIKGFRDKMPDCADPP